MERNTAVSLTADGTYLQLPGLGTVHSHAFQRAMRGLTQRQAIKAGSFWSWRGLMYQLAERVTPETMYAVARLAYMELALSGVTMVGEFHYVHHQADGRPYDDRLRLAEAVIRAAKDVGIRLALIRTAYLRAGFEQDFVAGQRRFYDPSLDEVVADVAALQKAYAADPLVSVGVAAHSVRAVPLPQNKLLADWAEAERLPFHMHVCEQRRELAECMAEHGTTPVQLLADNGVLGKRFVGVHATHLTEAEVAALGEAGCFVAVCRTTERDLGDGLPPTAALVQAGARLCVGVDSHCGENAFEELRAIELDARSLHEARVVVGEAPFLLDVGTRLGYEACGFGEVWGEDVVFLARNDVALVGLPEAHLVDGVVFNATPRAVREVWVGGRQIIADGHHADEEVIVRDYLAAMNVLLA